MGDRLDVMNDRGKGGMEYLETFIGRRLGFEARDVTFRAITEAAGNPLAIRELHEGNIRTWIDPVAANRVHLPPA